MIEEAREVQESARQSKDIRLRILASRELGPVLKTYRELQERAKAGHDDLRRKAYEVLTSLPDSFVRALRDGDQAALQSIEKALRGEEGQEGATVCA
jgi:hypothetical protein